MCVHVCECAERQGGRGCSITRDPGGRVLYNLHSRHAEYSTERQEATARSERNVPEGRSVTLNESCVRPARRYVIAVLYVRVTTKSGSDNISASSNSGTAETKSPATHSC
jgi:hypothetical protein